MAICRLLTRTQKLKSRKYAKIAKSKYETGYDLFGNKQHTAKDFKNQEFVRLQSNNERFELKLF